MKTKFTPFSPPVDPRYPEANKVFQLAAGEAAHTPGRYRLEPALRAGWVNIVTGDGSVIVATVHDFDEDDKEQSAFIVRACNEYDHLKDVEKRHEVALQMLKEQGEREAGLVAALQALAATARTFRNVPKDEQEWTPIDEETLDRAFALLSTLNT